MGINIGKRPTQHLVGQDKQAVCAVDPNRDEPATWDAINPTMILAIETSCDDTCAAVVEPDGRRALSNVVHTQTEHARSGGVVPEVASRAHLERMDAVIEKALDDANVGLDDVAGVAVTVGPGLIGALLVGVSAARGRAGGP